MPEMNALQPGCELAKPPVIELGERQIELIARTEMNRLFALGIDFNPDAVRAWARDLLVWVFAPEANPRPVFRS